MVLGCLEGALVLGMFFYAVVAVPFSFPFKETVQKHPFAHPLASFGGSLLIGQNATAAVTMNRNDTVREVAERLSIAEIIGEYFHLNVAAPIFWALSVSCEKTPSFNVNPAERFSLFWLRCRRRHLLLCNED